MKKWMLIPLMILIVLLLITCQKQKSEKQGVLDQPQEEKIARIAQEIENKVSMAMENLAQNKIGEGSNLLLDVILLAKPRAQMPDDLEDKILAAKEQFQSGNISEGADLASEALLIFKTAKEIATETDEEKPAELEQEPETEEPFPIAEKVRASILSAKEEFKKGEADNGIILILESLSLFAPHKN